MSIADIKKMPIVERVYLMEQIWDTLNQETAEIDSPSWHDELLQERKKAIKDGDVKMYTPAELKSKRR
jgi:putative addiction module component (TIGR02574 family)